MTGSRSLSLRAFVIACAAYPTTLVAQTAVCNQPAADPIVHVHIAGQPFLALPSSDGCWIFVSFSPPWAGASGGVAVLRRGAGKVSLERTVPIAGTDVTGAALTHNGQMLIVTAANRAVFLDVQKLITGGGDPELGSVKENETSYYVSATVTADDHYLFLAVQNEKAITVLNLARAVSSGFGPSSVVGRIPTGASPTALSLSGHEHYLFATSESAPDALGWPPACRPEAALVPARPDHALGALLIIDEARAVSNPASAVVGTVAAGCDPVRVVLSPAGDVAYVSARGSDSLLAFDTGRLHTDPAHALRGAVHVGAAPIGLALIDGGSKVVVANSNRFHGTPDDKEFLDVIDAGRISSGGNAVIGRIPAGAFPRDIRVTSDGHTMLITNFGSRTLEIVDLRSYPLRSSPLVR